MVSVFLTWDKACDIVITRREVSRHHAQLAVDDSGAVWLSSLGREPVSVNGKPATDPVELFTGDQIEIFLEGRVKVLCFEAEDATIKINKAGPTPRKPLGDANQNTGALAPSPAVTAGKPSPASASRGRRTPAKRAAGPAAPPPAPPLPPPGSLLPGGNLASAGSRIPKPPPMPKPADLRNGLKKKATAVDSGHLTGEAAGAPITHKTAAPAAPGTFLPSADQLLALRAGLRKTGAAAAPEAAATEQPSGPPAAIAGKGGNAKKRKSVRFNIPTKETSSPEGVPTDATVALDFGSPPSPDVIINVNADSTAAFSAWAMGGGSAGCGGRRSLGDTMTGGLPCILEEAPEDCSASPPPAMQVTPSREITPMLRRRSGRTSSITCSTPESVGRKRRSCSGSRNGTPVSKGRPITADPEVAAAAAEEAALDASLAAAEATAITSGQAQEQGIAATLAAAAAQLEGAAEEAPEEEETPLPVAEQPQQQLQEGIAVEGTPSAAAAIASRIDQRVDSPATPWVPQIGAEAAAVAAALAAQRSATPASAPGSPAAARTTPGRRGRSAASGRKSRMSLPALAVQPEAPVDSPATLQLEGFSMGAVDVTEVLPQQFSAAKTGTLAPINTPVGATSMPSFAAVDMEGVAKRLAGLGADQEAPVCASASPAPQAGPCDTTLAAVAAEAVQTALAAVLPAPDVPMIQAEGETDIREVAALKEELEAAKMLAHAQQVRARALEEQLSEATALAARLQQANMELSARLQQLEQQAPSIPAPQDVAQGMDVDAPEQAEEGVAARMGMMSPPCAATATGAVPATKETSAVKAAQLITKTPTAAGPAITATPTTNKPANTPTVSSQTARTGTPATGVRAAAGGCSAVAAGAAGVGSASAGPSAGAGRPSLMGPLAQLPFDGLSQALSQGSLEWVDGLILPPGSSQDESAGASVPTAQPNNVAPEGAAQREAVADTPPAAPLQPNTSDEQALVQPPQEMGADAGAEHAEETNVDDVAAQQDEEAAEGVQQETAPHEEAAQAAAETEQLTLDEAAQQPDADEHLPEEAPAAEDAEQEPAAYEEPAQAAAEKLLPASEAAAQQLDAAVEAAADAPVADVAPPAHLAAAEAVAAALAAAAAGEAKGEMLPVAAAGAASADAQAEGEEEEEDDVCHVCGEADEGDVLLLCDGCDNACHLGCARPVLRRIPKNDWFCSECKAARSAGSKAAKRKAQGMESGTEDAENNQKPSKTPRRSVAVKEPMEEQREAMQVDAEPAAAEEPKTRSGRSSRQSTVPVQPPAPHSVRGRRASLAPVTEAQDGTEAPEGEAVPGSAVAQARTTRRRASLAQTPAAAPPAGDAVAPRTAASTRGARRKSVSPALDAAPEQVATLPRLGTAKRVPLASMEASLGPALGSLGVILEADEEMGSEADEGESAPAALPTAKPAPACAARGRKALQDRTNQDVPQPAPRRTRGAASAPVTKKARTVSPPVSPPKTRRSTRARS
ncbi:probable Bromodomain adjacent to zinc finger domain protein 2B at C-terminar half [Coccomyxa sp. Obi]|nr:probable Bromodomain adjacent to zinc finger domain protein 2B at C-terminar half [Coccomyxa sp. Obi]